MEQNQNSFKKVFASNNLTKYSWLISLGLLLTGFFMLYFDLVEYGATFFVLFPFSLGFAMGTIEDENHRKVSYQILSVIVFMGFLLANALEGLVCVFMALPIFALMVYIGYRFQKKRKKKINSNKLLVTISPLIILFFIDKIEQVIIGTPETVTITNSIILNYEPEQVFDAVKEMKKLDAEKPFLLMLGLPTPYKCELESDSIGSKRTCFFQNGKIVAEITKFEKGKILEMNVIDYQLTGRHWFHFIDAKYTFQKKGKSTLITRTSSYNSELNPRFYWQPLEAWGIDQEHTFVLNSLKKNLEEKYSLHKTQ